MRFRCPFCFYTVSADDSLRGYQLNCPGCSRQLHVPPSRFQDGCVIGDFVIRSKIGSGAVGTVYLATQLSLERQVALKVLLPEYCTRKGIGDLLREARMAASLNHINLIQSVAIGEEDGICYMAMPYISGGSVMDRIIREKQLPVDESLHIIQQSAEALHYVWTECGIVHRDIKPDNIMLTQEGIVKIMDFGMALHITDWQNGASISGSPSYMSPELFNGIKPDPRSDIYSLGITLYQMLSGRLPFESETVRLVAYQHMEEKPEPLDKLNPDVPPDVVKLVRRMMAKKPEDRFQNMEELLSEIWRIRQETAPDRNLVPEVHTVSVRRLDYEIQRDSVQSQAKVRELESEVRHRRRELRLTMMLVPAAAVLGIIVTLFWFGNAPIKVSAEARLAAQIEYFTRLVNDDAIPLQSIRDEGEKIIAEHGSPGNRVQELMLEKIRGLIVKAELRRLRIENINLKNALRSARRKNNEYDRKINQVSTSSQTSAKP